MSFFQQKRNRRFNPVIRPQKQRNFTPHVPAFFSRVPSVALIGGAVSAVALLSLAGIIFFSGQFSVETIAVEGALGEGKAAIEAESTTWTQNKLLGFVPRATLLFPSSSLERHLSKTFARLKSVEVISTLPHGITIVVQERERNGIWCAAKDGGSSPSCFFYGEDGVIFEDAPNSARGFLLRFVKDERFATAQAGERVLNDADLMDLEVLYAAFESGFEQPSYVVLASEEEVRVGFLPNWEARLSRSDNFVPQVENVALVIANRIRNRRNELEYIDARLGSRLFYKFRSAPAPVQEEVVAQ